jgi:hypothetical protein
MAAWSGSGSTSILTGFLLPPGQHYGNVRFPFSSGHVLKTANDLVKNMPKNKQQSTERLIL